MSWERVYTVPDWYDGPRGGVADFQGRPHEFCSTFSDMEKNADGERREDTFLLWQISSQTFGLVQESWQIWLRWERAFHAGETTLETHPALPNERARHEQLEAELAALGMGESRRDPESSGLRVRAQFEYVDEDGAPTNYRVRWTVIADPEHARSESSSAS